MKLLLLFTFLISVRSYCSFFYEGTKFYCEECCFWYAGEWNCKSYQYCYTFLGIALAIWIIIILIYAYLYFSARTKTIQRQRIIFERSQNIQINNNNESYQNMQQPIQAAQINVVELKQSNL